MDRRLLPLTKPDTSSALSYERTATVGDTCPNVRAARLAGRAGRAQEFF